MGMKVWRNIEIVGLLIDLGFFRSLGQFQGPWMSFRSCSDSLFVLFLSYVVLDLVTKSIQKSALKHLECSPFFL